MKSLTLAGIQRPTLFSPNHISNDAAIFAEVVRFLLEQGHRVTQYTEREFLSTSIPEKQLFSMIRSKKAVCKLRQLEQTGTVAINSAFGIENCTRENMTTLLLQHRVPHPESLICHTHSAALHEWSTSAFEPCWVKRADFHAIYKEDVTYVDTLSKLHEVVAGYALRGIERVVINKHLEGDLIKFYGVQGTDFFHWFYPQVGNHSKFGLEEVNGAPRGIPFSVDELRSICHTAAEVLNVRIYGGDCVVSSDGVIRIIDFNDWPSFAPCRKEAAVAIGQTILNEIEKSE